MKKPKRIPEHPMITLARAEPDVRRRRFIIALYNTVELLTADEMDRIEPILWTSIGRKTISMRHELFEGRKP